MPIATAVQAAVSLPLMFVPVQWEGAGKQCLYVDGLGSCQSIAATAFPGKPTICLQAMSNGTWNKDAPRYNPIRSLTDFAYSMVDVALNSQPRYLPGDADQQSTLRQAGIQVVKINCDQDWIDASSPSRKQVMIAAGW